MPPGCSTGGCNKRGSLESADECMNCSGTERQDYQTRHVLHRHPAGMIATPRGRAVAEHYKDYVTINDGAASFIEDGQSRRSALLPSTCANRAWFARRGLVLKSDDCQASSSMQESNVEMLTAKVVDVSTRRFLVPADKRKMPVHSVAQHISRAGAYQHYDLLLKSFAVLTHRIPFDT